MRPVPESALHGQTELQQKLSRAEPILRYLCRVILRRFDHADVEDAAQSIRIKLWQTIIPEFDPARGIPFDQYLTVTIRHALIDERRRLLARDGNDSEPTDVLAIIDPDADAEALGRSILARPEQYLSKAMVRLLRALMESPTRGDAAKKLGMTTGSVYVQSSVLKQQIRQLFENQNLRFDPSVRTAG